MEDHRYPGVSGPGEVGGLLVERLAEAYTAEPGVRVVFVPGGNVTHDWCWSGCGMVYVRVDSIYPSQAFPTSDTAPAACAMPLAVRFHVGVHRCIATMTESGEPPDPAEQSADALQLLDDADTLRCAIHAAQVGNPDRIPRKQSMLGAWTPQGPLGDCAGGFWPWTVRVIR